MFLPQIHKIIAGLVDAHELAGHPSALTMATRMVDYHWNRTQVRGGAGGGGRQSGEGGGGCGWGTSGMCGRSAGGRAEGGQGGGS